MGVNLLGLRRRTKIAQAIGLPVIRAWVQSHNLSGRYAYLTIGWTKDCPYHRHVWYDRLTGQWEFDCDPCLGSSCSNAFPEEVNRRTLLASMREIRDGDD